MDKLSHWDRNAPLPEKVERVIPWGEARQTVLDAYGAFAPDMASIAGQFFDKAWIDAPVRDGKAQGAFSAATVPSVHPYVLMNYQGKVRDVMTLAHELGHGVHQWLARDQGALLAPTPLTLAETASVFGEMLTFRKILAGTTEPRERKAMIAGKVEDMLNTVVRQIAFYTFERKVHEERRGGELTSDRLNAIWLEVQGESLGPAIVFKPGLHPFAVLRLRLRLRRLPGELALRPLPGEPPRLRAEVLRPPESRRLQAPLRAIGPLRPRRPRSRLLEQGPQGHRRHDRRARGHGEAGVGWCRLG
jgi:oligoendopeptidase F